MLEVLPYFAKTNLKISLRGHSPHGQDDVVIACSSRKITDKIFLVD